MRPIVVINDDGEVGKYQSWIIIKSRSVGMTTMRKALLAYFDAPKPAPQPKKRSAYDLHANGGLPQLKQRIDQMNRHAQKPRRLY